MHIRDEVTVGRQDSPIDSWVVQEEPYMMLSKPQPGEELKGNERFAGFCKDLADRIAHTLKIKCEC